MSNETQFDVLIIGAGPGGYVAAIRAAQLGLRVGCIEKERALGGTCLRIGCIPSKALLDSSELFAQARDEFSEHGIQVGELGLDLKQMLKRKDKVVKMLTGGVNSLFKKNKVERIQGTAKLVGEQQVEVEGKDGGTYKADHIVIATGSVPAELPFLKFDGKQVIDSTTALSLDDVPESLLVIGGGAIGLEMGSVWSRLGADVTVIEAMDRLVPGMDEEMSQQLQKVLSKQGLTIKTGTKVKNAEANKDGVQVEVEAGGKSESLSGDKVLVAVGRKPFTEGLGLESVGVELDDRGRIRVDDDFKTTADGIYAIGDVIAGPMLAHKAEEEGIACIETIAGGRGHVNHDLIPNVVYTWPELAAVGHTEVEAEAAGHKLTIGTFPFMANGRARAANATDGSVKIIADADNDRVLGVHILGPRASDLIAEATAVMEFGGSAEDIARTCHAHPTFAESVKEAALDVGGRVIHK